MFIDTAYVHAHPEHATRLSPSVFYLSVSSSLCLTYFLCLTFFLFLCLYFFVIGSRNSESGALKLNEVEKERRKKKDEEMERCEKPL